MIGTAGLALVIFALARSGRLASAPAAVGAYIGAASASGQGLAGLAQADVDGGRPAPAGLD